jgi:hypothetical protein
VFADRTGAISEGPSDSDSVLFIQDTWSVTSDAADTVLPELVDRAWLVLARPCLGQPLDPEETLDELAALLDGLD